MQITAEMIQKFDVAGPRYTSYPTAPVWTPEVTGQIYSEKLKTFGHNDTTLSLYIHLPFCRSLCTFCACNVVIRPADTKYSEEYLNYLFKEMDLTAKAIGRRKTIRQLHWGGGTPTFSGEDQIRRLYEKIRQTFEIDADAEVAIEIDPRTISESKIRTLRELGFNRISMGVQDFDETVQKNINRVQPFEMVEQTNRWCRELGFHSVNFDLIYGLPHQTRTSFDDTVEKVIALKPDRIALYSFAYVPWLKHHQRKIDTQTLPEANEKMEIFVSARNRFLNAGYQAIAMDHFALKTDELSKAFNEQKLYRNFMGYTVKPADEYIGLGMTAIGFLGNTFIQNVKELPEYYRLLREGTLPVERGKALTADDQIRQWVIHSLMCHFSVKRQAFSVKFGVEFDEYFKEEQEHLQNCIEDGLLRKTDDGYEATEMGRLFIRNVCMGFDWYLRQKGSHQRFSKTV